MPVDEATFERLWQQLPDENRMRIAGVTSASRSAFERIGATVRDGDLRQRLRARAMEWREGMQDAPSATATFGGAVASNAEAMGKGIMGGMAGSITKTSDFANRIEMYLRDEFGEPMADEMRKKYQEGFAERKSLRDYWDRGLTEEQKQSISAKIGHTAGAMVPALATGLSGAAMGAGGFATTTAAAGSMAPMMAEEAFQDIEKIKGVDKNTALGLASVSGLLQRGLRELRQRLRP